MSIGSAGETDRDQQSIDNKVSYMVNAGLVSPIILQIPLDEDLAKAFESANVPSNLLSKTDVLVVQVIRLLRQQAK